MVEVEPPGILPEPLFIEVLPDEPQANVFFIGLAGALEIDTLFGDEPLRVPVRLVAGFPRVYGRVGFRGMVDYARQSPLTQGTLAVATHVTYRLDFGRLSAYAGAGAGWQFDLFGWPQATEGPFVSGLLGTEYFITRSLGVFVEGTLDYYFNAPVPTANTDPYDYNPLYSTLGIGLMYHF